MVTQTRQTAPVPRRWWEPKVTQPSCRACGYAVRGLPSFTCPECGSDLREVGIDTPGRGVEFLMQLKGAGAAVAGLTRALARVAALGAPVTSFKAEVEVRHDGRVVFDPSVRLPAGRRRAVLVVREGTGR